RPKRALDCPFCPGNEDLTPPEIMRIGSSRSWQIRVVPNRFPILGDGEQYTEDGLYKSRSGKGFHDIVIETPIHDQHITEFSADEMNLVIDIYQTLMSKRNKTPGVRYTLIFKNYGRRAGASLKHSHSQVIAMPILPRRVREEIDSSRRYYQRHKSCIFCRIIAEEIKRKERIVVDNDHFIGFVPYAARIPFEVWIIPKRHRGYFTAITTEERHALARILLSVLRRTRIVLEDPPFNFFIHTGPSHLDVNRYYHYHLVIMPVTSILGGFELGSGFYVNQSSAEVDARMLREVG
ncbi:MAG TPA: galactose-1-phosphate uridylyltransferase, partial [bacterium (Candidatus Stahlbacteria)]|nr:galactose-1-phosphate uridylyltransferase [Candidatus Stahlbacteria bacterium]